MILAKERFFLYSSVMILILIGVYFTVFVDSVGFVTRGNNLTDGVNARANASGESADVLNKSGLCSSSFTCNATFTDLANWTRGGLTELYVFKINISGMAGNTANNNVTRINITGGGAGATSAFPTGIAFVQKYNLVSPNVTFQSGGVSGSNPNNWSLNITATEVSVANLTNNTLMGVSTTSETIFIYFNVTVANTTEAVVNWTIKIYNSTGGSGVYVVDDGLGLQTGIDGLPPRLNTTLGFNATDGTNVRTSLSTNYLRYNPSSTIGHGINITIALNDYNIDRVILVYNSTGGGINLPGLRNLLYNSTFLNNSAQLSSGGGGASRNFSTLETSGNYNQKANITSLATRSKFDSDFAPAYLFSFNISNNTWGMGATDGTSFNYVFVVYDLYNQSEIINNSNAEFVLKRDLNNPSVTLTEPTLKSVEIFNPIKYTCGGSDTSGLASCTTTVTKPSGSTVSKSGCSTEHTFTSTDTNEAGTYTIECSITDGVARTASTSSSFSVSASTGGGGGATSGGGGGGGSAGSSADNPVTVSGGVSVDAGTLSTTDTYTSVSKDGTVKFTVSGSSHSAKVLDITTDSVTIEVASTPSQLTLNVGETGEVDLNDDGTNDLSVTLRAITTGKADLVFKVLAAAAPSEQPSGETPGIEIGEEVQPSRAWLWIVLIVVAVVLVILYLGRKKQ